MSNIVEQIEHPAIQEMREEMAAKYEVEIATLTSRAEEAEEKLSDSESAIRDQMEVINNAWEVIKITGNGNIDKGKISLENLVEKLNDFSPKRFQRDWSVIDEMVKILGHVEIPERVRTVVEVVHRNVEVLPEEIKINGVIYQKSI